METDKPQAQQAVSIMVRNLLVLSDLCCVVNHHHQPLLWTEWSLLRSPCLSISGCVDNTLIIIIVQLPRKPQITTSGKSPDYVNFPWTSGSFLIPRVNQAHALLVSLFSVTVEL